MKKIMLIGICLLIGAPVWLMAQEPSKTEQSIGELTVVALQLKSNHGKVQVTLYNSQDSFSKEHRLEASEKAFEAPNAFRVIMAEITDRRTEVVFKDIPFGEYAVKVWHDENDNRKVDRYFTGMPKESVAFSNNVRIKFGPPQYDEAKFAFQQTPMTLGITMP